MSAPLPPPSGYPPASGSPLVFGSPSAEPPSPTAGGGFAAATNGLVVIGAVIVGISIFMVWGTDNIFERSRSANEVPLQLLWDTIPATFDSFAVRWPLLVGTVLMLGGALLPRARAAALIGSVASLATALLWVNGIRAVHADPLYDIDGGPIDSVGTGTWVCVAGSAIALVGSIAMLRRPAT